VSRRTSAVLVALVVTGVLTATGGVLTMTRAGATTSTRDDSRPDTQPVQRGTLSALVTQDGILTHRARADGSPYVVVNRASGTFTQLPEPGDEVGCGGVLYRVDDVPVLLLCGKVPMYRDLRAGDSGPDVRQLNRDLHLHGDDFDAGTTHAVEVWQRDRGLPVTGVLGIGAAVFLPEPVRVAKVTAQLGGPAHPGAVVLQATSEALEVQVNLDPSQQGEVKKGDRALVILPGHVSVTGRVDAFGRVAGTSIGQGGSATEATVPAYISLDRPARARGLDEAPVQVDITTRGVRDALSVPVTAIVGRSGGGFAVEVVRGSGQRRLVDVRLGLFDTTAGRVQVDGNLREGDAVVVPTP
jgi:peptidoglycan hydrolase-like protein with peptidoglycan-binding domain